MSQKLLDLLEMFLRLIGFWPSDRVKTMRRRRRRWKRHLSQGK